MQVIWILFLVMCGEYFWKIYYPSGKFGLWFVSFEKIRVCCLFRMIDTVYPKKYAHGFCFSVLCCGYTLTDFPISIRLTSLALWQSNDCPSASKATLMNMYKYFMWIHYERLHNHNEAKHNKTVSIFLGIYCKQPKEWCQQSCYSYSLRASAHGIRLFLHSIIFPIISIWFAPSPSQSADLSPYPRIRDMKTSPSGNIFLVAGLCAGN